MKKITQLNGFTLIEVLVVISIIGILAAFILPNLTGVRGRASDTQAKNNLNQLKSALRLYYNDAQTYPDVAGETACSNAAISGAVAPYLDSDVIPTTCMYLDQESANGFYAYITLSSGAGTEDTESANRCGQTVVEGQYYVCGKQGLL